jgi:predicted lipoprotein with Yx(FWY)xxD motif
MNRRLAVFLFVTAVSLAACGGGGSSGPSNNGINPPPGPTATPTPAASGNIPLSETAGTSAAWVDPSSHRTLYWLSTDNATGSACTGACLGVWPPLTPVSGSSGNANMTLITRSDGTGQQWAYQGHPLYHYAGDSGPDQTNGEGVPEGAGTWHVARPDAAAATPAPGGGGPPCNSVYC